MTVDLSRKVLIVGGGIAGLALAQILRANNVPFEVFERDEAPSSRQQGWSVSLAECLPELDALLPRDIGELDEVSVGHNAGVLDSVGLWDISSNKIINRYGGQPRGQPGWAMRVYRPHMREFLWQKVNVRTNKKFTHYTEDEDSNTVTAYFADGSSATGGLLVGADGAWSPVRRHMLVDDASARPQLSQYQMIMGSFDMSPEQFAEFGKLATSTVGAVAHGVVSVIATYKTSADGSAKAFWAICESSDDPAAQIERARESSKAERYDHVVRLAAERDLPQFVKDILHRSRPEDVSDLPITLTEWLPSSERALPRGRATLMGDALHNMIPFRGAGANTALRDSTELARVLIDAGWGKPEGEKKEDVETILRRYETTAVPRAREQVLLSRQIGQDHSSFADIAMRNRTSTAVSE